MKKTILLISGLALIGVSAFLANSTIEKLNDTITMRYSYSNGETMVFEEAEEEEDADEHREEGSDTKLTPIIN